MSAPSRRLRLAAHLALWWLGTTLLIVAAGAALGALVFPLVGLLVDTGYTPGELATNGARYGFKFFGLWAPGAGIVLTFMRVHHLSRLPARPALRLPTNS